MVSEQLESIAQSQTASDDAAARAIIGQSVRGDEDDEFSTDVSRRRPRELQYWKVFACSNQCPMHHNSKGWIMPGPVLSPFTAIEYTEFMETKHAKPLDKSYGVDGGINSITPGSGEMFNPVTRYNLILNHGGLHEFPDEQLIAYGWHRLSPVLAARPHLASVPNLTCEHGCPDRWFSSENAYQKHVKAMHNEAAGAREVGSQIEKILERTTQYQGMDAQTLAATIAQAVVEYERNKDMPLTDAQLNAPGNGKVGAEGSVSTKVTRNAVPEDESLDLAEDEDEEVTEDELSPEDDNPAVVNEGNPTAEGDEDPFGEQLEDN